MDPIRSSYESDPDMLEIVCDFARELPVRAARLEALLEARSYSDLQTLAHQLKGAGGGYGFAQITAVADEPARRARSMEPSVCPARCSTPPLTPRSGNTCPGLTMS